MISTHNIDPGCAIHPSSMGFPIFNPFAAAGGLVAAQAESAVVVGQPLPLIAVANSAGPGGFIWGSPVCVCISITVGTHGSTYRIVGINQFNKQVQEDIAPTAVGTTWTNNAYKQIISVTPLTAVSSTSQIAIGIVNAVGHKIGLPFRPSTGLQSSVGITTYQAKIEVVGLCFSGGSGFIGMLPGAINERYATLQPNFALGPGVNWLITKYLQKGFREK